MVIYDICYICPKCGSLQNTGERVNFNNAKQELDSKSVIDAYRLGSKNSVPPNILDLISPNLCCQSCNSLLPDLTAIDLIVKRPQLLRNI